MEGNARNPIYKEYGLSFDKQTISLKDLGLSSRALVNKQLIKFHLAYMYLTHQLKEDIGRGYTQDEPAIGKSFLSTTFYTTLMADFFVSYRQWLKELAGNQRSFVPFNLATDKLSDVVTDISPKTGLFKSAINYKNVLSSLNKESLQSVKNGSLKEQTPSYKLFTLLNIALDKLVDEKYEAIV